MTRPVLRRLTEPAWFLARVRHGLALTLLAACLVAPAGAQEVKLPLADYEALRTRAQLAAEPETPPALPWALESADLEIELGTDAARLRHHLELSLLDAEWQEIPLGQAGSYVGAELGGLEGRLVVDGADVRLRVRGRGRHRVVLESLVAARRDETATRPVRRFALRTPPAAVVRGVLKLGPDVSSVELAGPGTLAETQRDASGSRFSFAAGAGVELGFSLFGRRQAAERALLPLRFSTTTAELVEVARERLRVRALVSVAVAQGSLERLVLTVPAGYEVAKVEGPQAGWTTEEGRLIVTPAAPVEAAWTFEVELAAPGAGELASPLLRAEGGDRDHHLTATVVRGDGLLELVDAAALRGATPRELAQLPEALRHAGRFFAVLDAAQPPRWRVEWADATEVLALQVDRLWVDVAVGEAGTAAYQVWAELRNRGARHLTLEMPASFQLVEAWRDGENLVPGVRDGDLAVPLDASEQPRWIHLAGTLSLGSPSAGAPFSLPLPALSAPVARVEVRLVLPAGRRYRLLDATRAGSLSTPPSARAVRAQGLAANYIANQLTVIQELELGRPREPWPVPPGYTVLEAAWSALSTTPSPLVVDVTTLREEEPWF